MRRYRNDIKLSTEEQEFVDNILNKIGSPSSRKSELVKVIHDKYIELVLDADNKRYEQSRKKYKTKLQRNIARGEEFKKILKPGMVIICEGTRDRKGYRLVLALEDERIIARKIDRVWQSKSEWQLEPYITDHGYEKIKCILDDNPYIDGNKIIFKIYNVKN